MVRQKECFMHILYTERQLNVETKTFNKPDNQLDFHEHGKIDVIKLSDGTVGMYAQFKPGVQAPETAVTH